MNFFIKKLICVLGFCLLFAFPQEGTAKETIAILSDDLKPVQTNYYIFDNSANLMAQEIASIINKHGRIQAYSMTNSLTNSQKVMIQKDISRFLTEYKNSYTVNYPMLRKVAAKIDADYILLITTKTDTETKFLEGTRFRKWELAGHDTVCPSLRLITNLTLVDPNNEEILLTKNYDETIKSKDFDLGTPMYAPTAAQLSKIQDHSIKLAEEITPTLTYAIRPDLKPQNATLKEKINTKIQYTIWNKDPIYTDDPRYKNPPDNWKTKLYNHDIFYTPENL